MACLYLGQYPNSKGSMLQQNASRVILKQLLLFNPQIKYSSSFPFISISLFLMNTCSQCLPINPFFSVAMVSNASYLTSELSYFLQMFRSFSLSMHYCTSLMNSITGSAFDLSFLPGFLRGANYFLKASRVIFPSRSWSNLENIVQMSFSVTRILDWMKLPKSLGVMELAFWEMRLKSFGGSYYLLVASSCLGLSWAISASLISSKNSATLSCYCLFIINFITISITPTHIWQFRITIHQPYPGLDWLGIIGPKLRQSDRTLKPDILKHEPEADVPQSPHAQGEQDERVLRGLTLQRQGPQAPKERIAQPQHAQHGVQPEQVRQAQTSQD